jgi:Lon protease-like protein
VRICARVFEEGRRRAFLDRAMATVLENMQLSESIKGEQSSKKAWAKQNAAEKLIYQPESDKLMRLEALKNEVADLCDLQPTPASMVRPPRKVRR